MLSSVLVIDNESDRENSWFATRITFGDYPRKDAELDFFKDKNTNKKYMRYSIDVKKTFLIGSDRVLWSTLWFSPQIYRPTKNLDKKIEFYIDISDLLIPNTIPVIEN